MVKRFISDKSAFKLTNASRRLYNFPTRKKEPVFQANEMRAKLMYRVSSTGWGGYTIHKVFYIIVDISLLIHTLATCGEKTLDIEL